MGDRCWLLMMMANVSWELLNHHHTSIGFVVDSFNGYLYLSFPTFNNKSTVIQPQIDWSPTRCRGRKRGRMTAAAFVAWLIDSYTLILAAAITINSDRVQSLFNCVSWAVLTSPPRISSISVIVLRYLPRRLPNRRMWTIQVINVPTVLLHPLHFSSACQNNK